MAVTLNDLITSARQATNTLDSGFFDDTVEMPMFVNDAVSDVYDRVIGAYEQYFSLSAPFTLTTSNSTTLLAITGTVNTFYKELGVDYMSGGRPITVLPLNSYEERNNGTAWGGPLLDGPARRYFINGANLEIFPSTANFAGTYTLKYIPSCPVLTDVINLPVEMERWKKLIILYTAAMMKNKREQDTTEIQAKIQYQEKRIDDAARHRTKEGKFMPNRRGRSTGMFGGFYGYGGS